LRLFYIILGPGGTLVSALTLSSTAPASNHVCPGQEVIFTCSTEDSPTIAFASVEYIESDEGSQLEFSESFNMPGDQRISPINPNIVATLVENDIDNNGRLILISELHLIVLPQYPLFSITCFHANGTGITKTISVQGKLVVKTTVPGIWVHVIKNMSACHAHPFLNHLQLSPLCHKI
ncbi:MAG: hypothetical protein MJE68_24955, partial [Proteobacteria bacterium]|nr:hypothetical protein [Pseudomonadota bacterium]